MSPHVPGDLKSWFWVKNSRSTLALATSSCIRRGFSPKTRTSLQCLAHTALLSPILCSAQCPAMKIKAQQSAGSLLCCLSPAGGSRSRSRPAATPCPAVPGHGLAWAQQQLWYWSWAACAGEELQVTTIIISICIALFDPTDRAQNVPIITGTPCEHLWFSLHEITRFTVVSEKTLDENHYKAN